MSEQDETHGTDEDKDDVEAHGGGTWSGATDESRPEGETSDDVEAHGGGTWSG
jgi:hypothetical protein